MAEDDLDGTNRLLQHLGFAEELPQGADMVATALSQRVGVVANDVEDPEDGGRSPQMPRDVAVAAAEQRND